jgi:hypothetical protein
MSLFLFSSPFCGNPGFRFFPPHYPIARCAGGRITALLVKGARPLFTDFPNGTLHALWSLKRPGTGCPDEY